MTTYNEVIEGALKRLAVVQTGQTPSGEEYLDGLRSLNRMINGWRLKGVYMPFSTVADADGGNTATFDDEELDAIEANLALRLSGDYGRQPTPVLARDAAEGWNALYAKYGQSIAQTVDRALLPSYRPGIRRRITD